MKLNIKRGLVYGSASALCFAAVSPFNQYMRGEPIAWNEVWVGTVVAGFFCGLLFTLTDKFGSDVGDA